MIQEAIGKLVARQNLTAAEAEAVMNEIMEGKATDAQIGGFLIALRMKGETIDEIAACAKVMREKASTINPDVEMLVDTCGTGGDKSNTFNISTTTAFVVAGAGIAVAKHGNKSVSSKCGSADVLKQLGVNIELKPEDVEKCIEAVGIGFMFAPLFHSAMKYAIGPRKELATRTIFNVLGPLTNPANAKAQVVGVFDPALTEPLAAVLGKLGVKHAFVVHGNGLDEITIDGPTRISEYKEGSIATYELSPADFGMETEDISSIKCASAKESSEMVLGVLNGRNGAARNIVVLNAAAAIVAAGKAANLKDGARIAEESIDSGKALEKLDKLKEFTNK
jgi:anthranilate phosphoribosyltransferase